MVRTRTDGQRLADLLQRLQKYEECNAALEEEFSNETVSKQYTHEKCPSKQCKNPFENCIFRAKQRRIRRQKEAEVLQNLQDIESTKTDLSDETGYGQNLDWKPSKQNTNPFKKCIINRQIKAEKKRTQRKREAEVLKQLQDIERAKLESARVELARAQLERAKLARAELARTKLARAELASAELASADLAKAELNKEIYKEVGYKQYRHEKCPSKRCKNPFEKCIFKAEQRRIRRQREAEVLQNLQDIESTKTDLSDETGYGQNLDWKPSKQNTNPFKKCVINRQIKAEKKRTQRKREAEVLKQLQDSERAKLESARVELARAALARAELARAELARPELTKADLAKAELNEICKEVDYKQYRRRKPRKRCTNPFKKYVINRRINAKNKQTQRKREAEMQQEHLNKEFEKAKSRFRDEPEFEEIAEIPCEPHKEKKNRYAKQKGVKHFICFKKPKIKKVLELRSDSDMEFKKNEPIAKKESIETKVRSKPVYEEKPYEYFRDNYEICEPKREKKIKKRAELERGELARAQLARSELARAELARAELVRADLAKAELNEELGKEVGYKQYRRRKPPKRCTNPFKKYVINRQIKAEKKRMQRKREAEVLKQLQEIERAKLESARVELARAELARAELARTDLARAELARTELARAELARTELARAELARAELAKADLAKAESNEEICKEVDYEQYTRKKPRKRCTNPFKKYFINRRINTKNKQAQRKREEFKKYEPIAKESIETKVRSKPVYEEKPSEYCRDYYEICKPKRVKKGKKVKKTKLPCEYYKDDYEIYEPERVKNNKKTKLPYEYYRDDYEICKPKRVKKSKKVKKAKLPCQYYRDDYEICEPERVKSNKKTIPCEYYRDDYEICKPKRVNNIKKTKLPCEYYRDDYEICEPKIIKMIKKLKRKKKPLIKCTHEDIDEICETNANTPMIFNDKRCRHLYCINKRQDLMCDNTRKLTRKEKKILQQHLSMIVEQRCPKSLSEKFVHGCFRICCELYCWVSCIIIIGLVIINL